VKTRQELHKHNSFSSFHDFCLVLVWFCAKSEFMTDACLVQLLRD